MASNFIKKSIEKRRHEILSGIYFHQVESGRSNWLKEKAMPWIWGKWTVLWMTDHFKCSVQYYSGCCFEFLYGMNVSRFIRKTHHLFWKLDSLPKASLVSYRVPVIQFTDQWVTIADIILKTRQPILTMIKPQIFNINIS